MTVKELKKFLSRFNDDKEIKVRIDYGCDYGYKTLQTDVKALFLNNSTNKEIVIHGYLDDETIERTN